MMSITTPVQQIVPAVKALTDLATAAFAGTDVRIITGASEHVEDDDFVMICAPTDSGAGVLLRTDESDQGHAQQWTLDIVVLLSTYSPDRLILDRLDRVQTMLDTFVDVVASNPTLAGTVSVADVGRQGQVATFDNSDGCAAELSLTVACEIY